jgi:hypothetical protein
MWALPIDAVSEKTTEFIANLEAAFRTMEWPNGWHTEWPTLWRRIALEESLEYLLMSLEDHGFTFAHGEKTVLV